MKQIIERLKTIERLKSVGQVEFSGERKLLLRADLTNHIFYLLGILSRFMIRSRNLYYYPINGVNVLPLPLCGSSFFRKNFKRRTWKRGVKIHHVLFRRDELRLATGFQKKIIACNTNLKFLFAGRSGFVNTSFYDFLCVVEGLCDKPFFDLHWTSVDEIKKHLDDGESKWWDISDPQQKNSFELVVGLGMTNINRTRDVINTKRNPLKK